LTVTELFPGWELPISELWPPIFTLSRNSSIISHFNTISRTNREGAKDTKEEKRREEKDFIIDARIGRYTLSLLALER
jgi:hypothetical protein